LSSTVFGQTFDAASIRKSPPFAPGMPSGMRVDATHFITEQYPIRTVIAPAKLQIEYVMIDSIERPPGD